jgi:large subunit ribosomal protein L28
MSRKCPITGKGPMTGNNVSHSMRHTRRRWNVNLQTTTIVINGKKQRVRVSTSALRTLRKNAKATSVKPEAAKTEVKAEVKPEVKTEVKADAKTEVKAEATKAAEAK